MAVDVQVGTSAVDITFSGWDAVWALRRSVLLAFPEIVGARVAPVAELRGELGLRLGGTWLPGRVIAGNFSVRGHWRDKTRQLWCVYRDPEVLVIDTTRLRPTRVVLQHPGRDDLAWWIGERIGPHAAPSA